MTSLERSSVMWSGASRNAGAWGPEAVNSA
jgi:hypothetical protein